MRPIVSATLDEDVAGASGLESTKRSGVDFSGEAVDAVQQPEVVWRQ